MKSFIPRVLIPSDTLDRFKNNCSLNKAMSKAGERRGSPTTHEIVFSSSLPLLLKFLAPENTQTTPQTHAREIWIRKMGGRKEKRGWERERRSRTLLIRVVSVPVRQPWLIRFVRSLQGRQARIPEQGTVDSGLDWCCCSECKRGWKNILTFHLLFG